MASFPSASHAAGLAGARGHGAHSASGARSAAPRASMPLSLAASEPQLFCEGVCLPDELFWHIFSFLDIPSMLAVGATCRSWRRFVGESSLWDGLFVDLENDTLDSLARLTDRKKAGAESVLVIEGERDALVERAVRLCLCGAHQLAATARAQALNALSSIIVSQSDVVPSLLDDMVRVALRGFADEPSVVMGAINVIAVLAGEEPTRGRVPLDVLVSRLLPQMLDALLDRDIAESGYGDEAGAGADCLTTDELRARRRKRQIASEVTDPTVKCLMQLLVSYASSPAVVGAVFGFIMDNVAAPEWRRREAALLVFGAVADAMSDAHKTPLPCEPALYDPAFSAAIRVLRDDPVPVVRDTAAWAISNFFLGKERENPTKPAAWHSHRDALIQAVLARLDDPAALISSNACGIAMHLAQVFVTPDRGNNDADDNDGGSSASGGSGSDGGGEDARPLPYLEAALQKVAGVICMNCDRLLERHPTHPAPGASATSPAQIAASHELFCAVFDLAVGASTFHTLVHELVGCPDLTDTGALDALQTLNLADSTARAVRAAATAIMHRVRDPRLPCVAMTSEAGLASHRSRYAHLIGRVELFDAGFSKRCEYCSSSRTTAQADVRAMLLHALAPALLVLLRDDEFGSLCNELVELALGLLESGEAPSDCLQLARSEAAVLLTHALAASGPALAPYGERILAAIRRCMPVACIMTWQQQLQLLAALMRWAPHLVAADFDAAFELITCAMRRFAKDVNVANISVALAELLLAVGPEGVSTAQLRRVDATMEALLEPVPDERDKRRAACCAFHGSFYSSVELYLIASRSLLFIASTRPEFELLARRRIEVINSIADFDVAEDEHVVCEAVMLVYSVAHITPEVVRSRLTPQAARMVFDYAQYSANTRPDDDITEVVVGAASMVAALVGFFPQAFGL